MFSTAGSEPAFIQDQPVDREMPDQLIFEFNTHGGQFLCPLPGPANRQVRRIRPGVCDKTSFSQSPLTIVVQLSELILRIQTKPEDPGASQIGEGTQPDHIDLEGAMAALNG